VCCILLLYHIKYTCIQYRNMCSYIRVFLYFIFSPTPTVDIIILILLLCAQYYTLVIGTRQIEYDFGARWVGIISFAVQFSIRKRYHIGTSCIIIIYNIILSHTHEYWWTLQNIVYCNNRLLGSWFKFLCKRQQFIVFSLLNYNTNFYSISPRVDGIEIGYR